MSTCCHCQRDFHYLGLASHRAACWRKKVLADRVAEVQRVQMEVGWEGLTDDQRAVLKKWEGS